MLTLYEKLQLGIQCFIAVFGMYVAYRLYRKLSEIKCDLSQLKQTDSLRKVLETVEAKIDEWIQEAKQHE